MPKVIFVRPDGSRVSIEASGGASVMQTALEYGIDEIVAECGGSAMCATCHVYVDPNWLNSLPQAGPIEEEMLTSTASERLPNSRLSCQLILDASHEGLTVTLPERQQ